MTRRALIAANWKMHKTLAEAEAFVKAFLAPGCDWPGIEVALAPPFTALAAVGAALQGSRVKLAAQDTHFAEEGAYTGEISPRMLQDLGCTYVIVGHSERRRLLGESDEFIHKKLRAVFTHELIPILCVGETQDERRMGATERILERQLLAALNGVTPEQAARLVIAYEPVWAIGTGQTASPEDAERAAHFLRKIMQELWGTQAAESVRIQYGGSVRPDNALELMAQPNVDGLLVGGASLDPIAFAEIVKAAAAARKHARAP